MNPELEIKRQKCMSKDKVALIIGAGDYLGSAIVKRFAKEGFHAVGTRRRGDIESFVKEIEDAGGKATGIHSDARKEEQVVKLIESVENEIGIIEVLVFYIGGNVMFPILDTKTRTYTYRFESVHSMDACFVSHYRDTLDDP